jgi:hypothetical protein
MKHMMRSLALVLALPLAAQAQVLTFEGTLPTGATSAPIGNYYNGGAGPDYGIEFSSNALGICLNTLDNFCTNGSRGGQGDPASQYTGLFFLEGSSTFMNRVAGFTDGFSFFYSAISVPGAFSVWSGLNGTGSLLATLVLPTTAIGPCPGYGAQYCPFVATGVSFAGTAQSVTFAGVADQIAFDDVTFGSSVPGTVVPEPGTLTLLATGLIGVFGIARRRRNAA